MDHVVHGDGGVGGKDGCVVICQYVNVLDVLHATRRCLSITFSSRDMNLQYLWELSHQLGLYSV